MDLVTLILITVVLVCVSAKILVRKKEPVNLPPSVAGTFTILFRILFQKRTRKDIFRPALKYGEIYSINIGLRMICLNSYRAIHEAFVGQADVFSGRMKDPFTKAMKTDAGLFGSDGPIWQEHRRFYLKILRDFGLGKSVVAEIIHDEMNALIQGLKNRREEPIETQPIFNAAIVNVIARLVFGERCGTDDKDYKLFTDHLEGMLQGSKITILAFIFPFILKIPLLRDLIPMYRHQQGMNEYIRKKIHEQEKALESMGMSNDVSQANNVCEAVLIERAYQERSNPGNHTFIEWQIIRSMVDLFTAGSETTATTLNWATALLAIHLDIQERVRKEIDEIIGRQKLPTMADRQILPYADAVVDEVLRYSSILTSNGAHRTTEDTELLGFHIPANSMIQSNLYVLHRNPEHWEKPDEFYPQHFLTTEGKYSPSKYLLPFSIGKRACLGESLARMEIFIALVMLMQNFKVTLANPNADIGDILEGNSRLVPQPGFHHIIFTPHEA